MNLILSTNSLTSYSKIFDIIPSKTNSFLGKITPLRLGLFIGASAVVGMIALAVFCLIKRNLAQRKLEFKDVTDSSSPKKDPISTNTDFNSGNIDSTQNFKSDPLLKSDPVQSIIGGAKNYYGKDNGQLARDVGKKFEQDQQESNSSSSTQTTIPNPTSDSTVNPPEIEEIKKTPPQIMTKQWILKTIRPTNINDLKNEISNCKSADKLEIFLPKINLNQKNLYLDIFKEIADAAPNLESLTLIANDENGIPLHLLQGFGSISELKNLKLLEMDNISAQKLSLSQNVSLENLEIKNCIFNEFPSEIKDLKNLQKLSIARNLFDEKLQSHELEKKYSDLLSGLKGSLIEASLQDFRLKKLPEILEGDAFEEFFKLKELDIKGNPFDVNPSFPKQRIDQNILMDDISQIPQGLVKPGQNVLIVGRTRSGKSTVLNVLGNKFDTKSITLFSETKKSCLTTIELPEFELNGETARMNFQDTPGLFELRQFKSIPRTNNEILNTICKDHEMFFGGIGFSNIHRIIFTIAVQDGLNSEDCDSISVIMPFLRRIGLPSTAQLSLVITRCENMDDLERLDLSNQLKTHPDIKSLSSKYKFDTCFSGGIGPETKQNGLEEVLDFQEKCVTAYRIDLIKNIFKGVNVTIAPNVTQPTFIGTIENKVDGGVI